MIQNTEFVSTSKMISSNFGSTELSLCSVDSESELSRKYCICQSMDINRFMICCDNCDEWYHGDCIGITEKSAQDIAVFYCETCKVISPRLRTVYKKNTRSKKEFKKVKTKRVGTGVSYKKMKIRSETCDFIEESKNVKPKDVKLTVPMKRDVHDFNKAAHEKMEIDDRGHIDMDCSLPTDIEDDIRKINQGFVEKWVENEETTLTCQIEKKETVERNSHVKKDIKSEIHSELEFFLVDNLCRKAKAKALSNILSVGKTESDHKRDTRKRPEKGKKKSENPKKKAKDSQIKPESVVELNQDKKDCVEGSYQVETVSVEEPTKDRKSRTESPLIQCYGPECINAARKNSKYCSNECGMKLALNRIYEILPQRIGQWQTIPCAADENDRKSLSEIRRKMQDFQKDVAHVEKRIGQLNDLIHEAKNTPHRRVLTKEIEDDDNTTVYCKICGIEIPTKVAVKHMENCYKKYESLTIETERTEQPEDESWNIFCNFDMGNYIFCKKLRVLCPFHYKEPKNDDEVCGYPLRKNLTEYSNKFCGEFRKNCSKHLGWENLFRAQLDLDKLRLLTKYGDLEKQENEIKRAMVNRGGLMALMLHQTIVH